MVVLFKNTNQPEHLILNWKTCITFIYETGYDSGTNWFADQCFKMCPVLECLVLRCPKTYSLGPFEYQTSLVFRSPLCLLYPQLVLALWNLSRNLLQTDAVAEAKSVAANILPQILDAVGKAEIVVDMAMAKVPPPGIWLLGKKYIFI
jgi:hypothetical protein